MSENHLNIVIQANVEHSITNQKQHIEYIVLTTW